MASDFDQFTDVAVATLLMLCKGAADADLNATIGGPAVETVLGYPPGTSVPAGSFPLLLIYRQGETAQEQGATRYVPQTTFAIQYVASNAVDQNVGPRWPLLPRVWWSMIKALQQGYHPSVSSGAEVMAQAGLRLQLGATSRVTYQRLPGTEAVFPSFSATIACDEFVSDSITCTDVDDLPAFLEMHTTLTTADATATTPDLTQTVSLDGYSAP